MYNGIVTMQTLLHPGERNRGIYLGVDRLRKQLHPYLQGLY